MTVHLQIWLVDLRILLTVEEAITESPQEEQRDDQAQREDQGSSGQIASGHGAGSDGHASSHNDGGDEE